MSIENCKTGDSQISGLLGFKWWKKIQKWLKLHATDFSDI